MKNQHSNLQISTIQKSLSRHRHEVLWQQPTVRVRYHCGRPSRSITGKTCLSRGKSLNVTNTNDLAIALNLTELVQKRPYIYQNINGKRVEVEGRFKISPSHPLTYTFELAPYNKNHPLIIDPVLSYSTYLGGSNGDGGEAIAVDSAGNIYITGDTNSADFPTASPLQGNFVRGRDVFITKEVGAPVQGLVWHTSRQTLL